jgi:hypothetical protein
MSNTSTYEMTTYSLPVKRVLKISQPSLLVLLLAHDAVVADYFFLVPGLQQLYGDASLLLRLPH